MTVLSVDEAMSSFKKPKDKNGSVLPSNVLATLVIVFTEVMFFTALISAFLVIKAGHSNWSVPTDIRLPVMATGLNTLVLMLSGWFLWLAGRLLRKGSPAGEVRAVIMRAILLGGCFVCFQGYEWIQLIGYGMTMKSSIFGAVFFLLVGSHALHAVGGIIAMSYFWSVSSRSVSRSGLISVQLFWGFIVAVWPILYGLVYF